MIIECSQNANYECIMKDYYHLHIKKNFKSLTYVVLSRHSLMTLSLQTCSLTSVGFMTSTCLHFSSHFLTVVGVHSWRVESMHLSTILVSVTFFVTVSHLTWQLFWQPSKQQSPKGSSALPVGQSTSRTPGDQHISFLALEVDKRNICNLLETCYSVKNQGRRKVSKVWWVQS